MQSSILHNPINYNQTFYFGGTPNKLEVTIDGTVRVQNYGWTLNDHRDHIIVTDAKKEVSIAYSVLIPVPA